MSTFTDSFPGSENPLSENGTWVAATGWGAVQKASGVVEPTAINTAGVMQWTTVQLASDHFSQVTTVTYSGTSSFGPCVRIQADGSCYLIEISSTGPGRLKIFRFDGTSGTDLGTIAATSNLGDTIRLAATGSTLDCIVNGVSAGTRTDATYTGGKPGIFAFSSTAVADAQLDNWVGGDSVVRYKTIMALLGVGWQGN